MYLITWEKKNNLLTKLSVPEITNQKKFFERNVPLYFAEHDLDDWTSLDVFLQLLTKKKLFVRNVPSYFAEHYWDAWTSFQHLLTQKSYLNETFLLILQNMIEMIELV